MLLQSFDWGCFNCLALVSLHKALLQRWRGAGAHASLQTDRQGLSRVTNVRGFWGLKCESPLCCILQPLKAHKQYTCFSINHVHDQIRDCLWLYWVLCFSKMYCIKMSLSETVLGSWMCFLSVRTVFANKHACSLWEMEFQRSCLPCDLVSSVGLHSWAF